MTGWGGRGCSVVMYGSAAWNRVYLQGNDYVRSPKDYRNAKGVSVLWIKHQFV